MVKFSKFCSESFHCLTDRRCCLNVVKYVRREIGEIVRYLPDQKAKFRLPLKLSLLRGSRPQSARASPQQCAHSSPDFIHICSLSAEL